MKFLNQTKLYKKLYKKNLEAQEDRKIAVCFKKKQMWGNGL